MGKIKKKQIYKKEPSQLEHTYNDQRNANWDFFHINKRLKLITPTVGKINRHLGAPDFCCL